MLDERINVIICTRNRQRTLESCMRSLSRQSYKAFSVIIVDQSDNDNIFLVYSRLIIKDRIFSKIRPERKRLRSGNFFILPS
jgi:glycosyltransferase involved in cell wall biosynthesis